MSILDRVNLPENADTTAVCAYLLAQEAKAFDNHATFMAPDVHFNGLVLNAQGAERIAEEMNRFLPAVATLTVDVAARVEDGTTSRYMVLYQFQLQGQRAAQPLCDHITVRDGKITRIDNVFDVTLLPQLG
ncbi:MAG: nuclear transport factor 2 family protein [Myxococcota bacterium]